MKRSTLALIVVLLLLIIVRVPGLHTSYYQDEYKWAEIVAPNSPLAGTIPHPPIGEKIYTISDRLFGNDNLRMTPLLFSILNCILLYFIVKKQWGTSEAFVAVSLFAISYYSILASLMVDTDGQILPFFFLVATLGYYYWQDSPTKHKKVFWLAVCVLGLLGGLLTKLSAVIPAGAIMLDALYLYRNNINKRLALMLGAWCVGGGLVFVLILLNARYIVPGFNISTSVTYWEHFFVLSHRNYVQTFIQVAKALLYTSPLLLLPIILTSKEIFKKTRVMWIFLALALIFYIVIFDFSDGALDRYFQFLVVPLCIIIAPIFTSIYKRDKHLIPFGYFVGGIAIAFGVYALQFVRHVTPPLYPKTEWISRMVHLKLNVLFPFMGGSGPLGFYVSMLFMAVAWVISLSIIIVMRTYPKLQKPLLVTFVLIGIVYNGVLIEEYLFGGINGSTRALLSDSISYIQANPSISHVTTYNDIGGFELMQIGKYRKRLYIDPKFDIQEKIHTLNTYKEHYLVIDIPHIDENSVYARYFKTCTAIFDEHSQAISSTVYDCTKAPDISL